MNGLEREVAEIAAGQHGVFSRRQAESLGATGRAIQWRVRTGRWEQLAEHVFRVAGSVPTWHQCLRAAQLEAGSGAVASHRSAAALLRVPGFDPGPVEVLKKRGWHHDVHLGRLRETSWLPPEHLRVIDGIPCTSLARTVFDLAGTEHPRRAERALENSMTQLGLTVGAIAEVVAEIGRRGRPGTALMRRLVEARGPGYVPVESELESLFVRVLEAYGVPQPIRQWTVGTDEERIGRVDFAYPDAKLVIELNSKRHHSSLVDMEADDERYGRLEALGLRVMVVKWRQLVQQPEQVIRRLRQVLGNVRCDST